MLITKISGPFSQFGQPIYCQVSLLSTKVADLHAMTVLFHACYERKGYSESLKRHFPVSYEKFSWEVYLLAFVLPFWP
jgi:hypothetical protein